MGKLGLVYSGQWNDSLGTYTNFERMCNLTE